MADLIRLEEFEQNLRNFKTHMDTAAMFIRRDFGSPAPAFTKEQQIILQAYYRAFSELYSAVRSLVHHNRASTYGGKVPER